MFIDEYKRKLRTPDDAVKIVKSGDWVDYSVALGFPYLLDKALARRKDELTDVKIRGNLIFGPIEAVECDPLREHFIYNSWHCSPYERKLCDQGLCNYIPMIFRNVVPYYHHFLTVNVVMICVTPMDSHGYFNLSTSTGVAKGIINEADVVIVEVNEKLPKMLGGFEESVHISEVDYIVEGDHPVLPQLINPPAGEVEIAIADHIIPKIESGSTLQLGVGALPDEIGKKLAQSDVKDLGMHTELASDAYLDLFEAGKLTNSKKKYWNGKGVTGFALGTDRFYEWIDDNPGVVGCPLTYVNSPYTISKINNMVSINSCIAVDIYGQISSETSGLRHISGTGGQLDYVTGASDSSGGKSFICMKSVHTDRYGVKHSNIKPHFEGDIITTPRSQAYYIVTEYGIVNLEGRSTWERAEMLISLADPSFRDELIAEAEKQKIWRRSNKIN